MNMIMNTIDENTPLRPFIHSVYTAGWLNNNINEEKDNNSNNDDKINIISGILMASLEFCKSCFETAMTWKPGQICSSNLTQTLTVVSNLV